MRYARFLPLAVMLSAGLLAPGCASIGKNIASQKKEDEKLLSQLSLARLTERHGQAEQARQIYKAILRDNPDNQTSYHRLAILSAEDGDMEGAAQNFEKAVVLGDPSSDLLRDYGYLLYLQHRLEDAERATRDALAKNGRNKAARNNLGLILGEQGRFDEALAEFRQGGGEAEAQANMAYAYTLVGDFASAEMHYHRALEIDTSLKPAAEGLIQLSELRKRRMSSARAELAAAHGPENFNSNASESTRRLEAAVIGSIRERQLPPRPQQGPRQPPGPQPPLGPHQPGLELSQHQPYPQQPRPDTRTADVRHDVQRQATSPQVGRDSILPPSMQPPLLGGAPLKAQHAFTSETSGPSDHGAIRHASLPDATRFARADYANGPAGNGDVTGQMTDANSGAVRQQAGPLGPATPVTAMQRAQQSAADGLNLGSSSPPVGPSQWAQPAPWQTPTWTAPNSPTEMR